MNIYTSERLERQYAYTLSDLFVKIYTKQITIPLWKKMYIHALTNLFKIYTTGLLNLDVYFIYTNEYERYGLKLDNKPTQAHVAITYFKDRERKEEGEGEGEGGGEGGEEGEDRRIIKLEQGQQQQGEGGEGRERKRRHVIVFDLTLMEKMYGRLQLFDYFSINNYAIIISHELVHLQILNDPTIPSPPSSPNLKPAYHRFLDEYQSGNYELAEIYDKLVYKGVTIYIYNYELFKEYADKHIRINK